MHSAMVPFLHNLMAQAGLAQEKKGAPAPLQPGVQTWHKALPLPSLSRRMARGDVQFMLHFGSFLTERERDWEGQAEENACRSVPAMEQKVEHNRETHF